MLLERLSPLPTEVMEDSGDPPNPWRGYQKCISDIPDCTHLLVIQDDAFPCENFPLAVTQIAEATPDLPVVLFLGGLPRTTGANAMKMLKLGWNYCELWMRDFMPVVAVLWPKHKAEAFLAWSKVDKLPGSFPRSDDAIAGRWMIRNRERVLVTIPSLVEHPDTVTSTIGRRAQWGKDKGRVARMFIDGDPLAIDWTRIPPARMHRHREVVSR